MTVPTTAHHNLAPGHHVSGSDGKGMQDSVKRDKTADKANQIFLAYAPKLAILPTVGASATGAVDAITSGSMLVRSIADITPSSTGAPIGADPAVTILGATSTLNMANGALAVRNAFKRLKESLRMQDKFGVAESSTILAKGGAQALGGLGFGAYRGMQAASLSMSIPIAPGATGLGAATYWLGFGSSIAFSIFFALISVWTSMTLYKEVSFSNKLKSFKTDQEKFVFLMEKLTKNGKIRQELGKTGEQLTAKGLDAAKEHLQAVMKELGSAGFSMGNLQELTDALRQEDQSKIEQAVRKVLAEQWSHISSSAEIKDKVEVYLQKLGMEAFAAEDADYYQGYKALVERSETKMRRILGSGTVDKLLDIAQNSKITESEMREAVAFAEKELKGNILTHSLLVTLGVFAVVVMGMTTFSIGILSDFTIAVIYFLLAVAMMAFDSWSFFQHLEAGKIGQKDNWLMGLSLTLAVATLTTSVVLLSIGTGGMAPLAFTAIIGLIWIASSVSQIYMRNKVLAKMEQEKKEQSLQAASVSRSESIELADAEEGSSVVSAPKFSTQEEEAAWQKKKEVYDLFVRAVCKEKKASLDSSSKTYRSDAVSRQKEVMGTTKSLAGNSNSADSFEFAGAGA